MSIIVLSLLSRQNDLIDVTNQSDFMVIQYQHIETAWRIYASLNQVINGSALSRCLKQCWHIKLLKWHLGKISANFNKYITIFTEENAFQMSRAKGWPSCLGLSESTFLHSTGLRQCHPHRFSLFWLGVRQYEARFLFSCSTSSVGTQAHSVGIRNWMSTKSG